MATAKKTASAAPTAKVGKVGKASAQPVTKGRSPLDTKAIAIAEGLAAAAGKAAKTAEGVRVTAEKEKPSFKVPKTMGAAADEFWSIREKRKALAKQVEELQAHETFLKEHIINTLPKSEANGVAGKLCRVSVVKKPVPRVEDWPKVYAHIVAEYGKHAKKKDGQQDGAFALLQRRVGEAAVKEAWDAGKAIPGVGKFDVVDLSVSKL